MIIDFVIITNVDLSSFVVKDFVIIYKLIKDLIIIAIIDIIIIIITDYNYKFTMVDVLTTVNLKTKLTSNMSQLVDSVK